MENASKALIIAGAILLSILIIALGIYVFNMAKGASSTNALSELEVSQFNQQFTMYKGKQLGANVINLIDKLVANATANKDSEERLPEIVYLDNRGINNIVSGAVNFKENGNVQNFILSKVGLNAKDYSTRWIIMTTTGDSNISAIGSMRSIMAEKHYYHVYFNNSNKTGLIQDIIIVY